MGQTNTGFLPRRLLTTQLKLKTSSFIPEPNQTTTV